MSFNKWYSARDFKIISSSIKGLIVIIALAIACFQMGKTNREELILNYSHLLLGLVIGWVVGHIVSPYNSQEKEVFSGYIKAVAAFVSGYILSKADKLIDRIIDPSYFFNNDVIFRSMTLFTSAIVAMVITFVHRKYGK